MDDDRAGALAEVRCPSCGARSTSGVSWCSLCFADMSAGQGPDTEQPTAVDAVDAVAPKTRQTGPGAGPPVAEQVDALLAELAARERPRSRFGALSGLVSSPAARVGLMIGGTVLVTAFGFGLMAGLGALL